MYHSLEYVIFTSCNLRLLQVRAKARAREWDFSVLLFFACIESDKHLCLAATAFMTLEQQQYVT